MANMPAFQASDESSILSARTRYYMKKIVFIGQAPARPSSKHEVPGTYLYAWLQKIGLSEEQISQNCYFYALIDHFPGSTQHGHAAPSSAQIAEHLPSLRASIVSVQPDIIVPVGKQAIEAILGAEGSKLVDIVGNRYEVDPLRALGRTITCIPLSHPSGRSTWNAVHKKQVADALSLLKGAAECQI